MLNTARLLAVLIWGLALGSCDTFWGYEDVPLYCTQNADCTYAAFPNARFCDIDGQMQGVKNRCIDQPVVMCESSAQCLDPGEPICDPEDQVCRACEDGPGGDAECSDATAGMAAHCLAGACVECLEGVDCGASAPICDAANTCQPCASNDECAAQHPGQPICSGTGACVECAAHADCASQVCDVDAGTCVDEGDIIYVNGATGTDSPTCGAMATPCQTIGGANGGLPKVTEQRKTIKLAAVTYMESIVISGGQSVKIIGPATIEASLINMPVMLVRGDSHVTLHLITLQGALGGNNADGLRCQDQGTVLELREVSISNNQAVGIKTTDCTLTVEQSLIRANLGGGVSLTESEFTLRNNFVVSNGTSGVSGSPFGGLSFNNSNTIATQILEFNTVADSKVVNGAIAAGVLCTAGNTITAPNNIVYITSKETPSTTVAGNCAWTYSNIEGGAPGEGNIDMDPRFVDPVMGNFHLQADSPCRDMADPAATLAVDFDGDTRPQGARHDMGADEIVAP